MAEKRLIVGVSGASGAPLAVALLTEFDQERKKIR